MNRNSAQSYAIVFNEEDKYGPKYTTGVSIIPPNERQQLLLVGFAAALAMRPQRSDFFGEFILSFQEQFQSLR